MNPWLDVNVEHQVPTDCRISNVAVSDNFGPIQNKKWAHNMPLEIHVTPVQTVYKIDENRFPLIVYKSLSTCSVEIRLYGMEPNS